MPIATNADQSIYEFGELLYEQGITTSETSSTYATDGFNNIRKSPLWLVRAGRIYTRILDNMANGGYYWSSTVVNNNDAYRFYLVNSRAMPYNDISKLYGWSVRCIVR